MKYIDKGNTGHANSVSIFVFPFFMYFMMNFKKVIIYAVVQLLWFSNGFHFNGTQHYFYDENQRWISKCLEKSRG